MKKLIYLIILLITSSNLFAQNLVKTNTIEVNFRQSPEISNNIICTIPKGTLLNVILLNRSHNDWIKINYNGEIGYVYYKYLKNSKFNNSSIDNSTANKIKYYRNSKGAEIQSPTHYNSPPPGATAQCWDGTYSFSRSRRGTCSHHGGVKKWLK